MCDPELKPSNPSVTKKKKEKEKKKEDCNLV
jgi:hypothetical protein